MLQAPVSGASYRQRARTHIAYHLTQTTPRCSKPPSRGRLTASVHAPTSPTTSHRPHLDAPSPRLGGVLPPACAHPHRLPPHTDHTSMLQAPVSGASCRQRARTHITCHLTQTTPRCSKPPSRGRLTASVHAPTSPTTPHRPHLDAPSPRLGGVLPPACTHPHRLPPHTDHTSMPQAPVSGASYRQRARTHITCHLTQTTPRCPKPPSRGRLTASVHAPTSPATSHKPHLDAPSPRLGGVLPPACTHPHHLPPHTNHTCASSTSTIGVFPLS